MKRSDHIPEAMAQVSQHLGELDENITKLTRIIDNSEDVRSGFKACHLGLLACWQAMRFIDAALRMTNGLPVVVPEQRPTLRIVKAENKKE